MGENSMNETTRDVLNRALEEETHEYEKLTKELDDLTAKSEKLQAAIDRRQRRMTQLDTSIAELRGGHA